jgi:hypothetical protein
MVNHLAEARTALPYNGELVDQTAARQSALHNVPWLSIHVSVKGAA